ncbi:MAG: hypothetical protein M3T56_12250 [Chloroflexota bacterium]|nr:hypothetical protein [Chloroflexota bacterium]
MKLWMKAIAVGGLAVCALVFVWRGGAAASSEATCAPASGFVLQFCVNVPGAQATRRDTTVPLYAVATLRTDLRVEAGIPANEILRVATALDSAALRVEHVFGRPFSERPRVLLFATPASFAKGAEEIFDYPPATALLAANSYGGIVDQATLTIAVDWRAVGGDLSGLLAHELVHVMIRDITGRDALLPAWFEEGLATVIQREDTLAADTDALAAESLRSNGVVSLAQLVTPADWHRAFARVGRPQYAVAALAVRAMETQVGEQGLVTALVAVGAGASFQQAYAQLGSGSLPAFVDSFDAVESGDGQIAVTRTTGPTGDRGWTIYAFTPNSEVRVHISGVSNGYDLTFTVMSDDLGMFRGSFGSTAAPGAYIIAATSGARHASVEIVTAR